MKEKLSLRDRVINFIKNKKIGEEFHMTELSDYVYPYRSRYQTYWKTDGVIDKYRSLFSQMGVLYQLGPGHYKKVKELPKLKLDHKKKTYDRRIIDAINYKAPSSKGLIRKADILVTAAYQNMISFSYLKRKLMAGNFLFDSGMKGWYRKGRPTPTFFNLDLLSLANLRIDLDYRYKQAADSIKHFKNMLPKEWKLFRQHFNSVNGGIIHWDDIEKGGAAGKARRMFMFGLWKKDLIEFTPPDDYQTKCLIDEDLTADEFIDTCYMKGWRQWFIKIEK